MQRYGETDGEEGYVWREGSTILLLTTKGRKTRRASDRRRSSTTWTATSPVIVASKGGAPDHPGWFKNLVEDAGGRGSDHGRPFRARARRPRARSASGSGEQMNEIWPHYDEYQEKTERRIPVVVLEPVGDARAAPALPEARAARTFPFGPETSVFKVGGKMFALAQLQAC